MPFLHKMYVTAAIIGGAAGLTLSPAYADPLTEDEISDMLSNSSAGSDAALSEEDVEAMQENRIVVKEVVKKSEAGTPISDEELTGLLDSAKKAKLASLDLEVRFEYGSDELTQEAAVTLTRLGKALTDDQLKGGSFFIAGHTDAVGGDEFNRALSQRRAAAVRTFLLDSFSIKKSQLLAKGFGEAELKDRANPNSATNRRVEIINLTTK